MFFCVFISQHWCGRKITLIMEAPMQMWMTMNIGGKELWIAKQYTSEFWRYFYVAQFW